MTGTTITIPLDPRLAQLYHAASDEERQKIQALFAVLLQELATPGQQPLSDLMDTLSDSAQARGLTPGLVQSWLSDKPEQP